MLRRPFLRPLTLLAAVVPLAAAAALVAGPAGAATTASAEVESFTRADARSGTRADTTASGGAHLNIFSNGAATGSLSTSSAGTLLVRARGDQYGAQAPNLRVAVDGRVVADIAVPATAWTWYSVPGVLTAGSHTVTLAFTNDAYDPVTRADRNLRLDVVRVDATTTTPTTGLDAGYAQQIVTLVNAERAKAGLAPLAVSTCDTGFAERWSTQMATSGTFAHQSLEPIMTSCRATAAGENIAYGNVTAEQMMTMWMNSAGHRANILNSIYTHIGVGAYRTSSGRVYGTQDFTRQ